MLRRLVALRHATERIEQLESELREQQVALAAVRSQVEGLLDAAARSDRILADMRQRYAMAAVVRSVRRPAAVRHVVVNDADDASSAPPDALVMVLAADVAADTEWLGAAASRLLSDSDVDAVIGDRVDVVGGRLLVTWADAVSEAAWAGAVVRGEVWNRAVEADSRRSAGELARALIAELATADRVAVESVVAVVAADS